MKKLAAAAVVVVLLIAAGITTTLFVGAGLNPPAPAGSCVAGQSISAADVPEDLEVAGYSGEQLANAATIMRVAQQQGFDAHGQAVAVMTAMGESSLVNVDHGDAVRGDTIGLFQTGPEHGPESERMDPAGATVLFLERLAQVEGWEQLEPTIAAHRAQRNADPLHYAAFWEPAVAVITALAEHGDGLDEQAPAASYDIGPVRPQTQALADDVGARFDLAPAQIGGYREGAVDANGHPAGLAVDFMTNDDRALGDAIVEYLVGSADRLSIDYIIWRQAIWRASSPDAGWARMADRGSETANHFDHPHVNLLPTPSAASGLGALGCLGASAIGASTGTGAPTGLWTAPLDAPITSVYGPRWGAFHAGTDFGAACGTPFYAAADGVVVYAGGPGHERYGLTGYVIVVDHGGGIETTYNHMYAWGVGVSVGDRVNAGDLIGAVGNAGNSTGCHLHYGVYLNGQHTDPELFMSAAGVQLS